MPTSRTYQYYALFAWLLLVAGGFVAVLHYTSQERIRALHEWEQRMSIVATSQAGNVAGWLNTRRDALGHVAENMSVRLYIMTMTDNKASAESTAAAETFLRNYLIAVAGQIGALEPPSEMDSIQANVEVKNYSGMAVVAADGKSLVSTRHFPAYPPTLNQKKPVLQMIDPEEDVAEGEHKAPPFFLFSMPVMSVQADESDPPIGWIVAAIPAFPILDELLSPEGMIKESAESYIVKWQSDQPKGQLGIVAPERLRKTPLNSSQYTLGIQSAIESPKELADGYSIKGTPGYDYGVPVPGMPWMLVREIITDQALVPVESRIRWLIYAYWTAVIAITFVVLALWRHVAAERLGLLLNDIQSHETLLEMVANHIPARIFITDSQQRICYTNREVAHELGVDESDLQKKGLHQVFGPQEAALYTEANIRVLKLDRPETVLRERKASDGMVESAVEVQHIPLVDIPDKYTSDGASGVLVIERDLTEIIRSKQARQLTLHKLIDTLVMMIDRRDPNAAHHSSGVAFIAGWIARTMQLGTTDIETVEIAGRLMNLGKLLVPQELLTSSKPLGEEDRELFVASMKAAIEYLAEVPFEGQVVETLQQSTERPDGAGPLSLIEEDIIGTALILAVANSFVAITSPRAWRQGMSVEQAKEILMKDAGAAYARPVVTALNHYLENMGGESAWQKFLSER